MTSFGLLAYVGLNIAMFALGWLLSEKNERRKFYKAVREIEDERA